MQLACLIAALLVQWVIRRSPQRSAVDPVDAAALVALALSHPRERDALVAEEHKLESRIGLLTQRAKRSTPSSIGVLGRNPTQASKA